MTVRRRGFTMIELLVVVSIIAVLAALTLSMIGTVRAMAGESTCRSNLRQLYLAMESYSQMNEGFWPPDQAAPVSWPNLVTPFLENPTDTRCFTCPQSNAKKRRIAKTSALYLSNSYGKNNILPSQTSVTAQWSFMNSRVKAPSFTVAVAETWQINSSGNYFVCTITEPPGIREPIDDDEPRAANQPGESFSSQRANHRKETMLLFFDGHAERLDPWDGMNPSLKTSWSSTVKPNRWLSLP